MARCSICGRPAIAELRYARLRLCREHFLEFFTRKVESTISKHGLLKPGEKVLLAVSGGKDSVSLAHVFSQMAGRLGVRPFLFHIDLGLGDYSEEQRRAVEELSRRTGLPLIVVSVRDILRGDGIPQLARKARRPECSVCGMVKRYLTNLAALVLGAEKVAMGHNLDDTLAYLLKNKLMGLEEYSSKLGPSSPSVPGLLAARIRPLVEVYERETLLYALASGAPFTHDECPFRPRESLEDINKEYVNRLEEKSPGTKLRLLKTLLKDSPPLRGNGEKLGKCRVCGMPASGDECSFCRLTRRVYGEPLGPRAREVVEASVRRALEGLGAGAGV